ncbi:unnamed protein product [Dracunculus medinensis]|uniref:Uncharacterized protein n=1 Tax=Dracunculus medinensis TaxID=318479 RepID=A0A0N4U645_DRAME|nr:unnamed protein product [Dracunculus medinensis]
MLIKKSLTPIGTDLESIIIAVSLFLLCGFLIFLCCFLVTHIYLFYKRTRLKRRYTRQYEDEFALAVLSTTDAINSECSV